MNQQVKDFFSQQLLERQNFCEFKTIPPQNMKGAILHMVDKFPNITRNQIHDLLECWFRPWELSGKIEHLIFMGVIKWNLDNSVTLGDGKMTDNYM